MLSQMNLGLWLHPEQTRCVVEGHVIHKHLIDTGMLADCVGLADLRAVKDLGSGFFPELVGKFVFGWKTISGHGVPCLHEANGKIWVLWRPLDKYWSLNDPALLHRVIVSQ